MPTNILMPALSPTMEEGSLAKWLVKEGDDVSAGDVIAEIETDKATMEVEAFEDGRIGKIVVAEGTEGVKVNSVIAILLGADEEMGAAAAAPAAETGQSTTQSPPDERRETSRPAAFPRQDAANDASTERVAASPLARRLAQGAGLSLSSIHGSGPHGRIVEADIEAARGAGAAAAPLAVAGAARSVPPGMSDAAILALYAPGTYELAPHDKMRRIIARRMTDAKRTIPHFYLTADLELDALLELRHEINAASVTGADGKPLFHVSLTDMIVMAMAMALEEVPDANVTWTEGGMLRHKHADIGVAVAIPGGGLITPIIRAADTKKMSEVSHELKDLVARGRGRKLLPEEYQGGVTSISNLGMYAIREFAAVINPPQSSILAVGAAEPRPVVRKNAVTVATMMTVTLATDHRAVDGVVGAELLKAFRHHIEKPAGMLV
jgi:pyruvate dehydrogenase E2 component (dihydrolipoamide acetyltransferase)